MRAIFALSRNWIVLARAFLGRVFAVRPERLGRDSQGTAPPSPKGRLRGKTNSGNLRAALAVPELRNMTPLQNRGLSRLLLRMPAWRVELRAAQAALFLDICEAYDLAWDGIAYWCTRGDATRVAEYREFADNLENDALLLALAERNLGERRGRPAGRGRSGK